MKKQFIYLNRKETNVIRIAHVRIHLTNKSMQVYKNYIRAHNLYKTV